jgi:hypothetical protein
MWKIIDKMLTLTSGFRSASAGFHQETNLPSNSSIFWYGALRLYKWFSILKQLSEVTQNRIGEGKGRVWRLRQELDQDHSAGPRAPLKN